MNFSFEIFSHLAFSFDIFVILNTIHTRSLIVLPVV